MKKRWYILASAVVIVFIIAGIWLSKTAFQDTIMSDEYWKDISVSFEGSGNKEKDLGAVKLTGKGLSEEFIRSHIFIEPSTEYKIKKDGSSSFLMIPNTPVTDNGIITIRLSDTDGDTLKKWAFQTENVFRAVSCYPYDGDVNVDTDTGIEVRFSENTVSLDDFKKAFSIRPECAGTFKQYNQTIVFIPSEELKMGTTYRITVDSNLKDAQGTKLSENFSFKFTTKKYKDNEAVVFYSADNSVDNFTSAEVPIVSVNMNDSYKDLSVKVELFRFDSFDAFVKELEKCVEDDTYTADVSSMHLAASFEAQPLRSEFSYHTASYIQFPEAVEKGWYISKYSVTGRNGEEQYLLRFLQISDISVYAAANSKQLIAWVNNVQGNLPMNGAEILVLKNGEEYGSVTDIKGTAIVKYAENADSNVDYWNRYYEEIFYDSAVVKVSCEGEHFAAIVQTSYSNTTDVQDNYYSYIYTNREIYKTSDIIRLWGVIKPRSNNAGAVTDAEVVLKQYSSDNLVSKAISVGADGTYMCELSYNNLQSGYYSIELRINGQLLESKYLNVSDFEKPNYVVSAETDREIYSIDGMGEINLSVGAKFFEGTPASELPVIIYGSENYLQYQKNISLDKNGESQIKLTYNDKLTDTWWPKTLWLTAVTNQLDSANSYGGTSAIVFDRSVMLKSEVSYSSASEAVLEVRTNMIDLSGIEKREQLYTDSYPDNIKGASYDTNINVNVYKYYYEKVENGEYYDFLYKRNVKKYNYLYKNEYVNSYSKETADGKAIFDNLPELEEGCSYIYEISCYDTNMRIIQETSYAYFGGSYINYYENGNSSLHNLSFKVDNFSCFSDNQSLKAEVQRNYGRFYSDNEGKFLVFNAQDEFYNINVYDSAEFILDFDVNNIPNIYLMGAYYENGRIYKIQRENVVYTPDERTLAVEIAADKERYKPGDSAEIEVRVKDKTGKPVEGANVCVSVSDESIFAIAEADNNIVGGIYSYISWDVPRVFTSYVEYDISSIDSEGGGEGGGVSIRDNFRDDLEFKSLKTDENGSVKLTVKLSDNLTSWRVTALAVTENLYGGSAKYSIPSGLPMFISSTIIDKFLAGDTVSFNARVYGDEIESSTQVKYEVFVTEKSTGKEIGRLKANKGVHDTAYFNFGKLEKGEYEVTIIAESGEYSDGEKREFGVFDSLGEIYISDTDGLNGQYDMMGMYTSDETYTENVNTIAVKKYPLNIFISNGAYRTYNKALNSMLSSAGIREDECIAMDYAKRKINGTAADTEARKAEYKLEGGDVSALAVMAAAANDVLDKNRMQESFSKLLADNNASSEEITSAYLGLAAYGKPVLNDIRFLLMKPENLSEADILRLCAALSLIGDYDSAEKYFNMYALNKLEYKVFDDGNSYIRYKKSENEMENVQYTALASITASIIHHEKADGMAEFLVYAQNNFTAEDGAFYSPLAELMIYTRYFVPMQNGERTIIGYTKEGKYYEETVGKRDIFKLTFASEQEYKAANISVIEGNPYITASYVGSVQEVSNVNEEYLKVEKIIEEPAAPGKRTKVTLKITPQIEGYISIEEFVPTGFRYTECVTSYNSSYYVSHYDNNSVGFVLNAKNVGEAYVIEYYINAVTTGEFVVEGTVASYINRNITVRGDRGTIIAEE